MISGFRRYVNEAFALLGDCIWLPTFWDSLSFPSSRFGTDSLFRNIGNYQLTLRNIQEERRLLGIRNLIFPQTFYLSLKRSIC